MPPTSTPSRGLLPKDGFLASPVSGELLAWPRAPLASEALLGIVDGACALHSGGFPHTHPLGLEPPMVGLQDEETQAGWTCSAGTWFLKHFLKFSPENIFIDLRERERTLIGCLLNVP